MTEYPSLYQDTVWAIARIFRQMREDPAYLDNSPYPLDVAAWLRTQAGAAQAVQDVELEDLETEAKSLFRTLKGINNELNEKEFKDKIAYVKAATSLIEKLLAIQERATDVKEYAKFQNAVIKVLEEVLTPEQRTQVMERLKEYI